MDTNETTAPLNGFDSNDVLYPYESKGVNEEPPQVGGKKSKAKKEKKVSSETKKPNRWLVHVAKVRSENPKMSYKEVLVHAKGSYKKE